MEKDEITRLFRHIPELECDRVTLRRMQKSDADDMFEYASNPAVTKYLLWDVHPDRRFTYNYLSYINSRYKSGEFYDWAIVAKHSGKMIGTCGFTRFNFQAYSAEIGYVLNPAYWGKGVAAEAARRVIRFGFDTLELHRIEARYMENNTQSRRVMEKLGMTYEGTTRDGMFVKNAFVSVGTYSILRSEYNEARIMSQML